MSDDKSVQEALDRLARENAELNGLVLATGVILTQLLPFADARVLALYGRFERAIYETLPA